MSTAFRRSSSGELTATFHLVELELLSSLVSRLLELVRASEEPRSGTMDVLSEQLGVDLGAEADRPDDPVLLRLFPDAYRDDSEAAADFRRYTERGLRETKSRSAEAVLASLPAATPEAGSGGAKTKLRLDPDTAAAWLRTLTDLRLALGVRLGVEQDDEDRWNRLSSDDPSRYVHDVYDWLGWVQETLVRALAKG